MRSNLISILMGWRDEKPRMKKIDVSLHVSGWILGEGPEEGGSWVFWLRGQGIALRYPEDRVFELQVGKSGRNSQMSRPWHGGAERQSEYSL